MKKSSDRDEASENCGLSVDGLSSKCPRRTVLRTGAAGAGILLAGCLEEDTDSFDFASTDDTDPEGSQSVREVALNVGLDIRQSVVRVERGTGWIIEKGIVVTCSHVVRGETVSIETFDQQTIEGSVIGRHEGPDLALVDCGLSYLKPLSLQTSVELTADSARPLVQVGHPNGVGTWIISLGSVEQILDSELLVDIPCGPGSSGSPLLTLSGEVVGMAAGTTVRIEGTNRDKPETVFEEFPGRRLFARATPAETIHQCVAHLL